MSYNLLNEETISSLKQRFREAIVAAFAKVTQKGGTVPAGAGLEEMAAAVESISSGTDVSDTTATASDVKSGKKFHLANGNLATGSMSSAGFSKNAGTAPMTPSEAVITPDETGCYMAVQAGYIDGSRIIYSVLPIPSTYKKHIRIDRNASTTNRNFPQLSGANVGYKYLTISEAEIGFTPSIVIWQGLNASGGAPEQFAGAMNNTRPGMYTFWDKYFNSTGLHSGTTWYIPTGDVSGARCIVDFYE